jgi:hypothetical protein
MKLLSVCSLVASSTTKTVSTMPIMKKKMPSQVQAGIKVKKFQINWTIAYRAN